jgi:hypothetical protein
VNPSLQPRPLSAVLIYSYAWVLLGYCPSALLKKYGALGSTYLPSRNLGIFGCSRLPHNNLHFSLQISPSRPPNIKNSFWHHTISRLKQASPRVRGLATRLSSWNLRNDWRSLIPHVNMSKLFWRSTTEITTGGQESWTCRCGSAAHNRCMWKVLPPRRGPA